MDRLNRSLLTGLLYLVLLTGWIRCVPAPEPYYGTSLGRLTDLQGIGLSGDVYIVNRTCLQVINFTYAGTAPDLFFWLDTSPMGLTSNGLKISTFEHGISPLGKFNDARVVLSIADESNITEFRSFGLWSHSYKKAFGHVAIPRNIEVPQAEYLDGVFQGVRYTVGSGPILILDRRTIKIFGFTYDGKLAPAGYFFVGKGAKPKPKMGVVVPVRGRDRPDFVTALNQLYTGDKDIILDLPENFDIYSIDYISLFNFQFAKDFGHVKVSNVGDKIPPYVPVQSKYDQMVEKIKKPWEPVVLWGHQHRTNFTFQLGPPGGKRGYEAMANRANKVAKPQKYVWYVNGYLAPELWLLQNRTYTFIVEGGNDPKSDMFDNHLYISSEPSGGNGKQDLANTKTIHAGLDKQGKPIVGSNGRLCKWVSRLDSVDPDAYDEFQQYKKTLKLECSPGTPGTFQWTPGKSAGDMAFYQSFEHSNMGGKINIAGDLPTDVPDFKEDPYRYEDYLQYQNDQAKLLKDTHHSATSDQTCLKCSSVVIFSLLLTIRKILS